MPGLSKKLLLQAKDRVTVLIANATCNDVLVGTLLSWRRCFIVSCEDNTLPLLQTWSTKTTWHFWFMDLERWMLMRRNNIPCFLSNILRVRDDIASLARDANDACLMTRLDGYDL